MLSRPSIPSFVPIIVTAALIYCLYKITVFLPRFLRRRTFKAEHGCQPLLRQFHSKFPVFGLDWIRTNLTATRHKRYLDTMCTRFENIGPTFKIQVLNQKAIATNEPENIKAILSLRFQDFTLRNRSIVMGKLLGKGIFTTDGQDWAHSRAMLRPNFVKEQIGDLDTFESHVQDLFKLIPRDGSTVDLQPLFFRFTLDSATDFLFGHSIHSLRQSEEADQRFGEAFDYALGELALRFRLGPFLIFRRNKKADEAFRTCRAYVDQLVDEALRYRQAHGEANAEKAGAQNLFLHALARETNDKDRIRDELLNILIAGRDSTASLLSHCFFEISRKPTVWQLLKKEVSPLDGKSPTYDQLRNLKYLKFCIQESLSHDCR